MTRRLLAIRGVVVLTALLGVNYVLWRWMFSVHWSAWWIAVPLVVAETYTLVDSMLFGMTAWRARGRGEPPPPPTGRTVDVFITTYNEPVEMVMRTARAAMAIRYPHRTWVLDDGDRAEMRSACEAEGIDWITRAAHWWDRPRHAKAGNINNALLATDGEFLLILDADQVPAPEILDRTLGWFEDEELALVQTPQWFDNVPDHDPLGSQAPLFYGPIQQGKDGWNAAFFCGSNALIRREALMQLGITRYVGEVQVGVHRAVRTARRVIRHARRRLGPEQDEVRAALDAIAHDLRLVRRELAGGAALFDVTYRFQRRVDEVHRRLVEADLTAVREDLAAIAELEGLGRDSDTRLATVDAELLDQLASRDWSPLGAIETVQALVNAVDVSRAEEAQPIMPLATISVTEDMATCMRLHGLGWRTAYVDEVLAHGLAPEDLQTMLTQRLRWAQGTLQVFFRENPLVQGGLSWPQRLMYFSTMWSYLSGFAAVVFIAAPVVYLTLGVLPVEAWSGEFFLRLIPFLVLNQVLFWLVADGRPTWRGQQYSLALFPVWIRAFTSAFANVFLHRPLGFAVTPKTKREQGGGPPWRLIRWQLASMVVLVVAATTGVIRLQAFGEGSPLGVYANMFWVGFDLLVLWVVVGAVRYRGTEPEGEHGEVEAVTATSTRGGPPS